MTDVIDAEIDAVIDKPTGVPLRVLLKERKRLHAAEAALARLEAEEAEWNAKMMQILDAEEKLAKQRLAEAQAREREVLARPTSAQNRLVQLAANGQWPPAKGPPRR